MVIILISQNASPGFLIFRKDLIVDLVERKFVVYTFATDFDDASREKIKELGATPVDYSLSKSGLNPFRDILDTWLLSKKIKSLSPDIVLSFFIKPSIYGTIAAKISNVPYRLAMLEGLGYIYTPSKKGFSLKKKFLQYIHGCLASISYAFAHKILFLNRDDPVDLSKKSFFISKKFTHFGPIGLSLKEFVYSPACNSLPIRFIFIARLLKEKGFFEFLSACRVLKTKYSTVEFIVLGDIDIDNPSSINRVDLDRAISENLIVYPGYVHDVKSWISKSHVFVLPSYREGFPRSIQEAMAIGRPIITTDVPGCRETVVDGVNGFKVPPFDVENLVEKMEYFINNPSEIKRMGDASHFIAVKHYDVNKINSQLIDVIYSK